MNNKRINIFFITSLLFFITFTAHASPYWNNFTSYTLKVDKILKKGNTIFVLTDGKLFSYNDADNSFETYIKNEGGNADITEIEYSEQNKCFVLTKTDGIIEILYEDKSYATIPYLKNTTQNIDKKINSIFIDGNEAYIAANFGFIIINIKKKEIKESGIFNIPFYSITSWNDKLYAATADGVYSIDKKDNLIDFSKWKLTPISEYYSTDSNSFEDKDIRQVTTFNDNLIALIPNRSVYFLPDASTTQLLINDNTIQCVNINDNQRLIINGKNKVWDYKTINDPTVINITDLAYIIPNGNTTDEYWLSSEGNNLSLIKRSNNGYDFVDGKRWLKPNGPASNHPFSLTFSDDQLVISGGGYTNINTAESGIGANISIYKNSGWTNIFSGDIDDQAGTNTFDFIYAINEPSKPNHIFASSWKSGLYEFNGSTLINNFNEQNSPIEEIVEETEDGELYRATRVGKTVFDKNKNLWVLNSRANNVIKIYDAKGEWTSLNYPEISEKEVKTNARSIIIDKNNYKWISSIGGGSAYIFVINDNGTPLNISNHKTKLINSFKDQNGKDLEIRGIYEIAEDNVGNMWIGTDIGPFTIKTKDILSSNNNVSLSKILVKKDENSNVVVPLLENIQINTIAIDGANRKWIATETAGVYLIDSENNTLEHFTIDNSPLPSNNILSLAIDNKTGTVYIGSERGLVSYKGGATKGSDDFSNVYAYPNPVRPNYNGSIAITGLKENSTIKITDVRGNLINQGKSLGGQYNWNGYNTRGQKVDTGVYIVFGSSEDGSEGVLTKIMFINH